jgi:hypothetical protein
MEYKTICDGVAYKHKIKISFFSKERDLYLYTNDETFNDTNIFSSRRSIDIPTQIEGIGEFYDEKGGGNFETWEDADKHFGRINSQEIKGIKIDEKDINDSLIKITEAYGYTAIFPLLYHMQITKDDSENVVNWYPTTGSTTIQNKTQRYSIKKLGTFMDLEDLLIYMQKNDL